MSVWFQYTRVALCGPPQKWSYPKGGMTEAAVSAKRAELAVWLREGLVKLGPTFIKIGQLLACCLCCCLCFCRCPC